MKIIRNMSYSLRMTSFRCLNYNRVKDNILNGIQDGFGDVEIKRNVIPQYRFVSNSKLTFNLQIGV